MRNLSFAVLLILSGIASADSRHDPNSAAPGVSMNETAGVGAVPTRQPSWPRCVPATLPARCASERPARGAFPLSSGRGVRGEGEFSTCIHGEDGGNDDTSSSNSPVGLLVPSPRGYVPDTKYKLRVGDRIAFQILEDRDLPKTLTVADSGEVDLPYLGRVVAQEKTCNQLATECKALLEKDYYYQASVVVALDTANRLIGRVYVLGQVRNQGPLEMLPEENLTAGKAIIRAGGLGDFANKKKVKVVRGGNQGIGPRQTFELNMVEILEKGKTEQDVSLEPDDLVIVPSRLINF